MEAAVRERGCNKVVKFRTAVESLLLKTPDSTKPTCLKRGESLMASGLDFRCQWKYTLPKRVRRIVNRKIGFVKKWSRAGMVICSSRPLTNRLPACEMRPRRADRYVEVLFESMHYRGCSQDSVQKTSACVPLISKSLGWRFPRKPPMDVSAPLLP